MAHESVQIVQALPVLDLERVSVGRDLAKVGEHVRPNERAREDERRAQDLLRDVELRGVEVGALIACRGFQYRWKLSHERSDHRAPFPFNVGRKRRLGETPRDVQQNDQRNDSLCELMEHQRHQLREDVQRLVVQTHRFDQP